METWLSVDEHSQQQIGDIKGSHLSFHHRPMRGRKGGGVGVLTGATLEVKPMPHSSFKSFEHTEVSIATSKTHVHLIVIYRPPPS